jgi:hypothetical protein
MPFRGQLQITFLQTAQGSLPTISIKLDNFLLSLISPQRTVGRIFEATSKWKCRNLFDN